MKPLTRALLALLILLPACETENPSQPATPSPASTTAPIAPVPSPAPGPTVPPLALSCQADPRAGETPLTVRFIAFPSGGTGSYDYLWEFGDGASSTAPRPAHTYLVPAVHAARLTLTSGEQVRQCERPITVTGVELRAPTPPPGAAAPPDLVISIVGVAGGQSYSPNPAVARVGQRVLWFNADTMTHTATANAGDFDTGLLPPGATSAPLTFAAPGAHPYVCGLHLGMVGTLLVTP